MYDCECNVYSLSIYLSFVGVSLFVYTLVNRYLVIAYNELSVRLLPLQTLAISLNSELT